MEPRSASYQLHGGAAALSICAVPRCTAVAVAHGHSLPRFPLCGPDLLRGIHVETSTLELERPACARA